MTKDEAKCLEIMQKMPPSQKLESAFSLYDFARQRVKAEIKRRKPRLKADQLNKMVNQRFVNQ